MEDLALGLRVRVVAPLHLALAGEAGLRHFRVDRVVLPRGARDGLLQHGQVGVAAAVLAVDGLTSSSSSAVLSIARLTSSSSSSVLSVARLTSSSSSVLSVSGLSVAVGVGGLAVLRRVGVAEGGVVALEPAGEDVAAAVEAASSGRGVVAGAEPVVVVVAAAAASPRSSVAAAEAAVAAAVAPEAAAAAAAVAVAVIAISDRGVEQGWKKKSDGDVAR